MNTVRPFGAFAAEGLRVGAVLAAVCGILLLVLAWVHPPPGSWLGRFLWLSLAVTVTPAALAWGVTVALLARAAWTARRWVRADVAPAALAWAGFAAGLAPYGAWLRWGADWSRPVCLSLPAMSPDPRYAWLPLGLALTVGSMLHAPVFGALHLTARTPQEVAEARRMHLPVAVVATAGMFAVGWALIELGWAPALA